MKASILIFIFCNLILEFACQGPKLGKTIEEKVAQDDLSNYEPDHSMEDLMNESIKEYIKEQNWKQDMEIDKESFKKMFVYLIQKGALKQGSGSFLKKLADKILEKHPGPIIVKNLGQYFNIQELTLTYTGLLNQGKTTDL